MCEFFKIVVKQICLTFPGEKLHVLYNLKTACILTVNQKLTLCGPKPPLANVRSVKVTSGYCVLAMANQAFPRFI